jgi:O-antigen/teichoic acid export membrane protein
MPSPARQGRARRVFRNTFFLLLARTWRLLTGFLLTPYMLHRLGMEQYGLFAVLGTVTQYFGLLDFGLGSTFVKHIAEYSARGETERVRQVVSFGSLFYLLLGAALMPVAIWLAPAVVGLLILSPGLHDTAITVLLLLFAYFFVGQACGVLMQLLNGLEQMHLTSTLNSASHLFYIIVLVLLLEAGTGIYGALAATFIQLFALTAVAYIVARKRFGPIFVNPFRTDLSSIQVLFKFGGWMQVNALSNVINNQTDRFIIASFVSVSSVTLYELGNKLALMTRVWPLVLLEALLPTASSLSGRDEQHVVDRAYIQSSRSVSLFTFGIGGFLVGAAGALFRVWVGPGYADAAVVLYFLVATYTINNLTGAGTTIVRAMGKPRVESYYAVLGAVLNVVATVALAPRYGIYGVLGGTLLGTVVGSAYFLWLFHRLRKVSLWQGLGDWLWRLTAATVVAAGALWMLIAALPDDLFESRLTGSLVLALLGVVYALLLLPCLRATRFLNAADLELIGRILPNSWSTVLRWRPVQYVFGVAG